MQLDNYIIFDYIWDAECEFYTPKFQIVKGFKKTNLKQAFTKTWKSSPSDRVFFMPGCQVPRYKVREKYSVTLKEENANAIFMGKPDKDDQTYFKVTEHVMEMPKEPVYEWYKNLTEPFVTRQDLYKTFKHITDNLDIKGCYITTNLAEHRHIDNWISKSFQDYTHDYQNEIYDKEGSSDNYYTICNQVNKIFNSYEWGKMKDDDPYTILTPTKKFINLLGSGKLYSERDILLDINSNYMIIDEDKYNEIYAYLNTDNEEDVTLACELMANCNVPKSAPYLLLLIADWQETIQDSKGYRHVNFKSLLNLLNLDLKKEGFKRSFISKKLRSLGWYTEEAAEILLEY